MYKIYLFINIVSGTKTLREIFDAIKHDLQVNIEDKLLVNELQITIAPFIEAGN